MKDFPKASMKDFPDPDDVGQSEYRAVYDHVNCLVEQEFEYVEVMDSLYELEEWVRKARNLLCAETELHDQERQRR